MIVGLDLSLSNVGLCAIPGDWHLEWKRVRVESFSPGTGSQLERMARVATRCGDFIRRMGGQYVFVEDYPRHMRSASVHTLAELGGIVKMRILEWTGLEAVQVNIASARKLFLGKLPRQDAKRIVYESLVSLGAPIDDADQADAIVVANFGLKELDGLFMGAA